MLREPASFLHSLHLQLVQNHVETETDFRKAIALEDSRRDGRQIPRYTTGRRRCCTPTTCVTSSSCGAIAAVFAPEQLLVLIYDDFRRDNEATLSNA